MRQELIVGGNVGDQVVEVRRRVGEDAPRAKDGFGRIVTAAGRGCGVVEGGGGGGDGGEEPGGVGAGYCRCFGRRLW